MLINSFLLQYTTNPIVRPACRSSKYRPNDYKNKEIINDSVLPINWLCMRLNWLKIRNKWHKKVKSWPQKHTISDDTEQVIRTSQTGLDPHLSVRWRVSATKRASNDQDQLLVLKIGPVVLIHAIHRAIEGPVKQCLDYIGVVPRATGLSGKEDRGFDTLLLHVPHHSGGI